MYGILAIGAGVAILSLGCTPGPRGDTAAVEPTPPASSYAAHCDGAARDSVVWEGTSLDAPLTIERRPSFGPEAGEGRADLRFVVDTLGLVELCNVKVLATTSPAFAMAVESSLADAQYSVPMRNGRPVRARLEVRFRVEGGTIPLPGP